MQEKSHLFYNIATTFGLTDLKDSKDRPLYPYGVDIDAISRKVTITTNKKEWLPDGQIQLQIKQRGIDLFIYSLFYLTLSLYQCAPS